MNQSAAFAHPSLPVASQTLSHTVPGSSPHASVRPESSTGGARNISPR